MNNNIRALARLTTVVAVHKAMQVEALSKLQGAASLSPIVIGELSSTTPFFIRYDFNSIYEVLSQFLQGTGQTWCVANCVENGLYYAWRADRDRIEPGIGDGLSDYLLPLFINHTLITL
jgi:hypothetical protein